MFQFDRPATVTALQSSSKLSKHRVLKFEKSAISETPKYFLKGIEQSYYTSRIRKPGRGNYAHMYIICLIPAKAIYSDKITEKFLEFWCLYLIDDQQL